MLFFFFLIDSFGSGTHDQKSKCGYGDIFLLLFISVIVDIKSIFKVRSFKTKK